MAAAAMYLMHMQNVLTLMQASRVAFHFNGIVRLVRSLASCVFCFSFQGRCVQRYSTGRYHYDYQLAVSATCLALLCQCLT